MQPTSPEALSLMSRRSLNAEFHAYAHLEYPKERADWVSDRLGRVPVREPQWDDAPQTWAARMAYRLRKARDRREKARRAGPVPSVVTAAKPMGRDARVAGGVAQVPR